MSCTCTCADSSLAATSAASAGAFGAPMPSIDPATDPSVTTDKPRHHRGKSTAAVTSATVGAVTAQPGSVKGNAQIVAQVAQKYGVDPVLAVAMMLNESGGNERAVGDSGSSFGLFQLHEGGMLTSAHLTPQEAYDPQTNAEVALRSLRNFSRKGNYGSPGALAAASQRPADPDAYAKNVNAKLDDARKLLGA